MSLLEQRQKIVDHLTQQKALSMQNLSCAYRSDDGLMCAVGCLIPDEIYSSGIEGSTVYSIAKECGEIGSFINSLSISVDELVEWQDYHDYGDYEDWCELLWDSLSPSYFAHKMSKVYGG